MACTELMKKNLPLKEVWGGGVCVALGSRSALPSHPLRGRTKMKIEIRDTDNIVVHVLTILLKGNHNDDSEHN